MKKNIRNTLAALSSAILFAAVLLALNVLEALADRPAEELTDSEQFALEKILDEKFPGRNPAVSPLPYKTIPPALEIGAESAILIDAETGNILFEKNADEKIPPASMTKLVEMYVVFEACENGEVSLDDIVPLPPESWWKNLPSDASLMFLGEGQKVTLRELLLGLSIASGNDASIAVAKHVTGDMDSFVERMNSVIRNMGLEETHFVESSGYSELNVTTAREFALFSRNYINRFPFALADFHAQSKIEYPKKRNLPYGSESETIVQKNTNKLLGVLDGCDGIKTGFIYESGYNLALTAQRNGARFISITMKGPGKGSVQGNEHRVKDGTTLMEFAFRKFYPYRPETASSFTVVWSGFGAKRIRAVPVRNEAFSVPFIAGNNPKDAAQSIQVVARLNTRLCGNVHAGQIIGEADYILDGKTLQKIPLAADREIACGKLQELCGKITVLAASRIKQSAE